MPTVTRKAKPKGTAKVAKAKASTTKATTDAKETTTKAKETSAKTRRTAEDVDKLVPEFLDRIGKGSTLRALKQEFGFSDDGPIRAALYRAGYDRKGESHGEEAGSINASTASGKKQLVTLRNEEGAAWYRLAYLSGKSEPEVKTLVAENGGSEGRVYVKQEKPAKAATGKTAGKGKTTAQKAKAKAKAKATDPS